MCQYPACVAFEGLWFPSQYLGRGAQVHLSTIFSILVDTLGACAVEDTQGFSCLLIEDRHCPFENKTTRVSAPGHWCHEIKVCNVKACKFRISTGEDTVDDQLHKINPSSWGAHVSVVADAVASNCDPSSIGVLFLFPHFTYYFGVRDFDPSIDRDVHVINDVERVSPLRSLLSRPFGSRANTLAEAPKFI